MLRTFNCGVGMVAVLPEAHLDRALKALEAAGERAWPLGRVVSAEGVPEVRWREGGTS